MYMYVKMMREWSRIRDFEIREDLFNVFLRSRYNFLIIKILSFWICLFNKFG